VHCNFFFHFGGNIEKEVKHWGGKVYFFQNLTTHFFMDQIYYNFKEIVDPQVMQIQAVFCIEWLGKCYILKRWRPIYFCFPSKMIFLHFWRYTSSLINQKTIFYSKLFYNIKCKNLMKIYSILILIGNMSYF